MVGSIKGSNLVVQARSAAYPAQMRGCQDDIRKECPGLAVWPAEARLWLPKRRSMSLANFACESFVLQQSSDFLKYDLYRVAATTAFRGATERVVDLAHSQTRRAARNCPDLGITENVARADDHGRSLTEDTSGMICSQDRDSWSCSSMALNLNR